MIHKYRLVNHRLMKDQRRQSRVIDLDQKVQESFAAGKGKAIVTKGPDGFLEGALLNKGVAEAHDRFMADVEVGAISYHTTGIGFSGAVLQSVLMIIFLREY